MTQLHPTRVRIVLALPFFLALSYVLSWTPTHAADALPADDDLPATTSISLPISQLDPAPEIPTIKETLGHDWAEQITDHASMCTYLKALAAAAPQRSRLVRYGESYEGRGLYYLAITAPENANQLDAIRQNNLKLSDPRRTPLAAAQSMISKMPAIVWFASSVHGNELSGTEAALLTGYHLLADRRPETKELLRHVVVLIDPLQNPDGRERFVNVNRESQGVFVNSHPLSTEHTERWPGGRFNHYLFDMNRDWFLHSQQETQGKVKAYLEWQPQLYVDLHEMGRNSTYFFVPPTDPVNPFMLPKQLQWLHDLGAHQAKWFDHFGFAFTTREIFDAFFPGYGSEWPTLQGGLGILWEQAGVRGLVIDRDDETKLHFREAVAHHYVSCLATLKLANERRQDLLSDFYAARSRGIQIGQEGPTRHFLLPTQERPHRTRRLARLLKRNGIDVFVVPKDMKLTTTDVRTGEKADRRIPQGCLHVPVAQPTGNLIRVLLDRRVDMDDEYVKDQLQRKENYLPDHIYDVTAWSLPLAFDVPCLSTDAPIESTEPWNDRSTRSPDKLAQAKVAYLVRPTDGAYEALCQWLQQGLRVHVTNKALTLGEREFPPGTLIIKCRENKERMHRTIAQSMHKFGLDVTASDTGFVTKGAHFGGPHVKWIRPPKILLVVDRPVRYSVGHTWHLFDQRLRYPTTRVSCHDLPKLDLDDFNVLILPAGSYTNATSFNEAFAGRVKQWVREGGTLVLIEGAATWAASEKIALVKLRRVAKPKPKQDDSKQDDSKQEDSKQAETKKAEERWPDGVPGAFFKATLFDQHWVTFGYEKSMNLFFNGNLFFEPVAPEEGRSIVQFSEDDDALTSGFCWPETRKLLGGKTYMAYFSQGRGHVIAFAGDPNYRAMFPSVQRLFVNACLFGPGQ